MQMLRTDIILDNSINGEELTFKIMENDVFVEKKNYVERKKFLANIDFLNGSSCWM